MLTAFAETTPYEEKKELLAEIDEKILLADGFEDALVGYAEIFNRVIATYDRRKCIEILMNRDGMTEEEAEEFFSYNVTGSFVGEYTPAFITYL